MKWHKASLIATYQSNCVTFVTGGACRNAFSVLSSHAYAYCLTDYDGVGLCLRAPATNGLIVHSPDEMWAWIDMVMMMPAGGKTPDSSITALLKSYQQRHLDRVGGMEEGVRISRIQYLWYVNGSITSRKILRHETSGVTSHPKKGVLRIFIASAGFEPATLGSSCKHTNYTTEATCHCWNLVNPFFDQKRLIV
jgi:hypothetical protein